MSTRGHFLLQSMLLISSKCSQWKFKQWDNDKVGTHVSLLKIPAVDWGQHSELGGSMLWEYVLCGVLGRINTEKRAWHLQSASKGSSLLTGEPLAYMTFGSLQLCCRMRGRLQMCSIYLGNASKSKRDCYMDKGNNRSIYLDKIITIKL